VADDAAEPPGQARQMDTVNPLALIRPVDPDGRPAHDPCVIACLLQTALFHARHINVQIETKGKHTPGMTVADGWRVTKRAPNAMVMGGVNREGFCRLLSEGSGGERFG
jgi:inosine-uridine nucleoside N-ribohydrolase